MALNIKRGLFYVLSISIMAFLIYLSLPRFPGINGESKARISVVKANMYALSEALELYANENGRFYPPDFGHFPPKRPLLLVFRGT